MSWIIGKPKAAVLPVPVWARPTRSLSPAIISGIASVWMGVGSTNPSSLTAFNNSQFF